MRQRPHRASGGGALVCAASAPHPWGALRLLPAVTAIRDVLVDRPMELLLERVDRFGYERDDVTDTVDPTDQPRSSSSIW
jgi:hypothetical protein